MESIHIGDLPPALSRIAFPPQRVLVRADPDGRRIYRSAYELGPLPENANVALERGAREHPERAFVRARGDRGTWETLTYASAFARARAIASGLLAAGAAPERPMLVLAPNGIAHALLMLGAHRAGVPFAPIGSDLARAEPARLARLVAAIDPAFAFVDPSLATDTVALALAERPIVSELARFEHAPRAGHDGARVTLDTVAKILFTSGSTGDPKGVIVTHRMIVANQVAFAQIWPASAGEPPVLVDWLPWSHAFGGNKVFNLALHRGGTLVVDDGRPTPDGFARTLRTLSEFAPTIYFGVPRSFAMLGPALARDRELRDRIVARLDFVFSAAAAIPAELAATFARIASDACARDVPFFGGWGATETAPGATCAHAPGAPATSLGVPLPGTEIALVASDGLTELRVRGPNVTPGYWRAPEATRAAFDECGYYRSGDAGGLLDESAPDRGFALTGRIAEHFKLSSGAWVASTTLRERLLAAAAPIAFDVLVTGADRDAPGALVYLDLAAAREMVGADLDRGALAAHDRIRKHVARALATVAAVGNSRAERIARAEIVTDEPLASTGELTAKGTIARGVALRLRARKIAKLHDATAADTHVVPAPSSA